MRGTGKSLKSRKATALVPNWINWVVGLFGDQLVLNESPVPGEFREIWEL